MFLIFAIQYQLNSIELQCWDVIDDKSVFVEPLRGRCRLDAGWSITPYQQCHFRQDVGWYHQP